MRAVTLSIEEVEEKVLLPLAASTVQGRWLAVRFIDPLSYDFNFRSRMYRTSAVGVDSKNAR